MKRLSLFVALVCLFALTAAPASALEYTVEAPAPAEFAQSTSVEPTLTADRGERPNVDLSKNDPMVAPIFGSNTSYLPGSGEPLYPFLGIGGAGQQPAGDAAAWIPQPGSSSAPSSVPTVDGDTVTVSPSTPVYGFTKVTGDLYYSGHYLGRLQIPSLKVDVKLYQGTGADALAKGAGHFEDTSIWEGNVCVAGHNRGVNCYFGDIHTLSLGDKITLTTKLGTRSYQVVSVGKISELDSSMLAPTTDNRITLFTCVRNQSAYRWCVQAVEAK